MAIVLVVAAMGALLRGGLFKVVLRAAGVGLFFLPPPMPTAATASAMSVPKEAGDSL